MAHGVRTFAMKARGPESNPQDPCKHQARLSMPVVLTQALVEAEKSQELTGQPVYLKLSFRVTRRP